LDQRSSECNVTLNGATGNRLARTAALAGAFAILNMASCALDNTAGESGATPRAAPLLADPIERMLAESESKAAEARELAGREPARPALNNPDASITARVVSALSTEPSLQLAEIHVRTQGRVVTLDGTTDTPQDRYRAAQVAVNVSGVRSVRNDILVGEDS
jgi:hyperosmotically inducible protein